MSRSQCRRKIKIRTRNEMPRYEWIETAQLFYRAGPSPFSHRSPREVEGKKVRVVTIKICALPLYVTIQAMSAMNPTENKIAIA